jgi:signal transduction histidine kinase
MEDGRKEYRFEDVETALWLRAVARDFEHAPAVASTRLEISIPDVLPRIRADGEALATAVHNLLDNAVKYSPGCDTVWLEARAEGSDVVISVRDRGIGIPAEERAHLFERFFRGRQLADAVKGTGLGLSLVHHIVSAHRGAITVASEPGQGTAVTIRLPGTDSGSRLNG